MTDREKRDKIIWNLKWAVNDEDVYSCLYIDDLEGVIDTMKDALTFIEALDVTPEELERLKLCRHECKVDCLLESFNRVVEERDAMLKAQEPVKPSFRRGDAYCGNCGCNLRNLYGESNYCMHCGKKAKWG